MIYSHPLITFLFFKIHWLFLYFKLIKYAGIYFTANNQDISKNYLIFSCLSHILFLPKHYLNIRTCFLYYFHYHSWG